MKFSIKNFFSKCAFTEEISSHLLKKSLMENFLYNDVKCLSTILKFLQDFPKLAFFVPLTKFSIFLAFIACHLSKIYLRSERKARFYLVPNFQFFTGEYFFSIY